MSKAVRSGAFIAGVLAAFTALSGTDVRRASAQPATTPVAQADPVEQEFQQGVAAARQGNFAEARRHYLEAWKIRRTHDVAANLGGAELQLGDYRDAAEHLRYALDHLAASKATEKRDAMTRDLEEAKRSLVTLRLHVEPANANVFLNGTPLGVAAELSSEVYADPGSIELRVELAGFAPQVRSLVGSRGAEHALDLALVRASETPASVPPAPLPPAGPAPLVRPTEPERNLVPFGIGLSVAAVAAGTAIGFGIDASNAHADASSALADAQGRFGKLNPCAPGRGAGSSVCNDLADLRERESRSGTIANAGLAVAGAAGVFAIAAYVLWKKPAPFREARVEIMVTREARGLALTARF